MEGATVDEVREELVEPGVGGIERVICGERLEAVLVNDGKENRKES